MSHYNITLFLERKFVSVRISVSDHIGALIMAGLHELTFNLSNFCFMYLTSCFHTQNKTPRYADTKNPLD